MGRTARPDRVLGMLGLAARAGKLISGTERVREAVRAGQVGFALVAADASDNTRDKLLPLLAARGTDHVVAYTRLELGDAVGRAAVSAVGLTDPSIARRVRELIDGSGVEE